MAAPNHSTASPSRIGMPAFICRWPAVPAHGQRWNRAHGVIAPLLHLFSNLRLPAGVYLMRGNANSAAFVHAWAGAFEKCGTGLNDQASWGNVWLCCCLWLVG